MFVEMPLRLLLLQTRRCSRLPPPQMPGPPFLRRALSILLSQDSTAPPRRYPPAQQFHQVCLSIAPPQPHLALASASTLNVVDFDVWPASLSPARGEEFPDGFDLEYHEDRELYDLDNEIDDMRLRKKLFYKLDRCSKEFDESNVSLSRKRKRDRTSASARNPNQCKAVEPPETLSSNAPKSKAKRAMHEDGLAEVKRERVLTFNQMTDPYHHPFCLDIHVTNGSVRACFVHRVTSRVVAVAHSISKDMKFDLGSRKGKGRKACAAVGALLAKRALEDDIFNAVYTPRKGDRIEGKIEIVLRAITENGVDVKVKLKQRQTTKNTSVCRMINTAEC